MMTQRPPRPMGARLMRDLEKFGVPGEVLECRQQRLQARSVQLD